MGVLKYAVFSDISKILGMDGKWKIDESGLIQVKKIEADYGEFKRGITIYDKITNEPQCIFTENGALITQAGKCESVLENQDEN